MLIHTEAQKGRLAYGYYDILQLLHDCNLTIHVLLEALSTATGDLPEVLYLQLDNSPRENKSKFMLSFFCASGTKGIISEGKGDFLNKCNMA